MSKLPVLPSPDEVLGDLLQRVKILEANFPTAALIITDGSVTVDPTIELDVDPTSLLLTDAGGGVADLSAGIPGVWTPVLHQASVDPTGVYVGAGNFVRVGHLVVATGNLNFHTGFTNGTGFWDISLPFHNVALGAGASGTALLEGFLHDDEMSFICSTINAPTTDTFTLQYQDAVPVSSRQTFDGTPWGATWSADVLYFTLAYYTND